MDKRSAPMEPILRDIPESFESERLTEAVAAIVNFAFEKLGARRVESLADDANDRSCRLCERLGFTLEGTLRHERVDPNGLLRSTRVYAKVK